MLNKFTDQNHDATYAVPTNAQLRLLTQMIREYAGTIALEKRRLCPVFDGQIDD